MVDRLEKYLGMPAVVGRSQNEVFRYVKDRVWDRRKRWHERNFSMVEREILIEAVLQAIPIYVMSCFLLPKMILHDIETLVRQFWWSGGEGKSMHWVSWPKLCSAKKIGGMGFRDLECFNLALLTKQVWRLVTVTEMLLARVLKSRYFPRATFFTAEEGERPSVT